MPRNRTTQKIVENWFKKSNSQRNYFDKFISLWISFNCFYNSEFDTETKTNGSLLKTDRDFIDHIILKPVFITNYAGLIAKKKFANQIDEFVVLISTFTESGYIRNLKNISNNREWRPFNNTNKSDFSAFISMIYQIRCNLFHGNKDNDNIEHKETIILAYKTLKHYLRKIYIQFGYSV